jgi:hypothetical protein
MKINKADLVVGGIYRNTKYTAIFVGFVTATNKAGAKAKRKLLWLKINEYDGTPKKFVAKVFKASNLKVKTKGGLAAAKKKRQYVGTEYFPVPEGCYAIKVGHSHTMTEKVGDVPLPADAIMKLHRIGVIEMQQRMRYLDVYHTIYNVNEAEHQEGLQDSLAYHYEKCHFYPVGDEAPHLEEYAQLTS